MLTEFLCQARYAVLIGCMVLVGLYLANYFLDFGAQHWVSRKVGHMTAGVAYLLAALLFNWWLWPIILSASFTLLLFAARLVRPKTFRGVGGSARAHAFAECWLPAMGTVCLLVGWAGLGSVWLAIVPILFVCWGDAITGVVRSRLYAKEVKGLWGSMAMLVACLVIAWAFYQPLWAGVVGAVAATLAERFTPPSRGAWDDNWTVALAGLVVMLALLGT